MIVCAFGSGPQSTAPDFFTYDENFVASITPFPAGWLTLTAMGIPSTPQETADF